MTNDPRVTRVGRIMRATALDELPQLWNIFVGDMSFVGPRALRPQEVEVEWNRRVAVDQPDPRQSRSANSSGRADGCRADLRAARHHAPNKFRYDRLYLHNQGFWFDVRLILLLDSGSPLVGNGHAGTKL